MWWECSECGGHTEQDRAPELCRECGTAGVIFVPSELAELVPGDPDIDSWRTAWLRAGLERGPTTLDA